MPGENQTKAISTGGSQELIDLIPRMRLLPGEDDATFEDLRQALLGELAPSTPYQTAIAENIIALEWETHRHRALRDSLIRSSFRELAQCTRDNGKVGHNLRLGLVSQEAKDFADALMSPTRTDTTQARNWLAQNNITVEEIVAVAYLKAGPALAPHERKLAELETRRRRLRQDYNQLKAARARPVTDAEIVDPQ
jgi:hypothetical protein